MSGLLFDEFRWLADLSFWFKITTSWIVIFILVITHFDTRSQLIWRSRFIKCLVIAVIWCDIGFYWRITQYKIRPWTDWSSLHAQIILALGKLRRLSFELTSERKCLRQLLSSWSVTWA
jgi:hypothetical protein